MRLSDAKPWHCSGDMYAGELIISSSCVMALSLAIRETEKSPIFSVYARLSCDVVVVGMLNSKLSGLMSP